MQKEDLSFYINFIPCKFLLDSPFKLIFRNYRGLLVYTEKVLIWFENYFFKSRDIVPFRTLKFFKSVVSFIL
jgi:hypothetical protein